MTRKSREPRANKRTKPSAVKRRLERMSDDDRQRMERLRREAERQQAEAEQRRKERLGR